jgi:hypothetical protein
MLPVVKNVLESANFSDVVEQLHDLLRFFDLKEHRHELVRQQQNKLPEGHKAPLSLLKPNDTRWSSTWLAAERVLVLKSALKRCMEVESIPNPVEFFDTLQELKDFLGPFRTATNVIQQDRATLYDVYQQFVLLWEHARKHNAKSAAAAAPAAPAASSSVRRTDSMVINRNYQFRDDWIEEENITMQYDWSKTLFG